jgi:hypothetical protein
MDELVEILATALIAPIVRYYIYADLNGLE